MGKGYKETVQIHVNTNGSQTCEKFIFKRN